MPSFKPKANKKIKLCKKYTSTLDGKHKEFVNDFFKDEFDIIPKLKEEKYSLNKQLEIEKHLNIEQIMEMKDRIKEINRKNNLLEAKYGNDQKYVRIHKRLIQNNEFGNQERKIFEALNSIKLQTDELVLQNEQVINNESYFSKEVAGNVLKQFKKI